MRLLTVLSRTTAILSVLLSVVHPVLAGQGAGTGEPGRRTLLQRAEEIALARSAAPADVSDAAEIWALGPREFERVAPGTNGVACLVSRDWLESLEPICYDSEGASTIMRITMRRVQLLHADHSVAETDVIVSGELASGALRLPQRPALAYMMSSEQRLIDDDGQPVGRWQPHLMIYYPYLTSADLGLQAEGDFRTVMLSDSGAATSVMIIALRDFVEPRATQGGDDRR